MEEDTLNVLRTRLREYIIKETGKTMSDIAREIGVSFPTFSGFIRSKGIPSIRTVLRIERFLNDHEKDSCCSCPWHSEEKGCCTLTPFKGCTCFLDEITAISGVNEKLMGIRR